MSSSSSKHRTIDTIHQSIRQWSYLLAEAIPSRRQTLNLPLVQPPQISSRTASSSRSIGSAPHRTATASLDADTTRKLRAECAARGLPLDSALVASLFLAAAEAVRVERAPRISARGHTLSARITRFAVLGLVCVVMAVLSGSVESKLMRYFCSFYAVIAGVWAVDSITVELPGYSIMMSTTAVIKAAEGAAGVTFTPVRMAMHCWRDLWETAERHGRAGEGMALSMSEFARFKMRTWNVRGRRWRRKTKKTKQKGEGEMRDYPPSFQLFGCIRLETGKSGDNARPAHTPMEEPGDSQVHEQPPSWTTVLERNHYSPIDPAGQHQQPPTLAPVPTPGSCDSGTSDAASLLLIVLDARYTLVYRQGEGDGTATAMSAAVPAAGAPSPEPVAATAAGTGDITSSSDSNSAERTRREQELVREGRGRGGGAGAGERGGRAVIPTATTTTSGFMSQNGAVVAAADGGSAVVDTPVSLSNFTSAGVAAAAGCRSGGSGGRGEGGLGLTLVEGKRVMSGEGAVWLLERACAQLVEACKQGPPLDNRGGGSRGGRGSGSSSCAWS